jgi:hypothetical protein
VHSPVCQYSLFGDNTPIDVSTLIDKSQLLDPIADDGEDRYTDITITKETSYINITFKVVLVIFVEMLVVEVVKVEVV